MDKHDVVVQAVKTLKRSEFGATAIKVELEANLDRHEDVDDVHRAILERLEPLGLSERTMDAYGTVYLKIKKPLVYALVYNDGSVDTELTFTLLLNKSTNILLLPKIIQIFKDVCEESGNCFDTDNAGMHVALINSASGKYPSIPKPYDAARFKNFRKSMIRLLPALYFLGSWNETSRDLRFREPKIERTEGSTQGRYAPGDPKYSAVAYRHGAVEFRLFETCYERPEVILDDVVVMSNAMQFWTRAYTRNHLRKVKGDVNFGVNAGNKLERLFLTAQHIDLLHDGLNILKPSYYTLNELKKQRKFTVTKKSINSKLRECRLNAIRNYMEYENQFKWRLVLEEQSYIRREIQAYAEGLKTGKEPTEVLEAAKAQATEFVKLNGPKKTDQKKYVEDEVARTIPNKGGRWSLNESDPDTPVVTSGGGLTEVSIDGTLRAINLITPNRGVMLDEVDF